MRPPTRGETVKQAAALQFWDHEPDEILKLRREGGSSRRRGARAQAPRRIGTLEGDVLGQEREQALSFHCAK